MASLQQFFFGYPKYSSFQINLVSVLILITYYGCNNTDKKSEEIPPLADPSVLCDSGCDMGPEPEEQEEINSPPPIPQCSDDFDNDGDNLIDGFDPGCESPDDNNELDPGLIPQCQDGEDNDLDGFIDYPDDLECESAESPYEERPAAPTPACSDGIDNDEDGNIDYPVDSGCGSPNDLNEEGDPETIPQCADGIDNDGDAYVDIADPGCVDISDVLELNSTSDDQPWCSDGIDNDSDGFIDFPRDPGCSSAGDSDELTPPFPAQCNDGIDNDDDGLIDFPDEPGCAGLGDDLELDPPYPPQCSDGLDNDFDGQTDYPTDTGCFSMGDDQELGPCGLLFESTALLPNLTIRGDLSQGTRLSQGSCGGQGGKEIVFHHTVRSQLQALVITTDLPENQVETALYIRRRCDEPESELICQREPFDQDPAQTVRIEEPELGDYYIFLDALSNASGNYAIRLEELEIPECRNEIDDDFDLLIDFPYDPGCLNPFDETEQDPARPPVCMDGIDNDGDNLSDYPVDLGCLFAGASSEEDVCGQGVAMKVLTLGELSIEGNTESDGSNRFAGSCGGANIREQVYLLDMPFSAQVTLSVDHPETIQPTLLHLRRINCLNPDGELRPDGMVIERPYEVSCNTGGESGRATLSVELSSGPHYLFVDHPSGEGGPYKLTVEYERLPPSCQNQRDDDLDGFIDGADSGCTNSLDDREDDGLTFDEINESPEACFDRIDNDSDGLVDFPFDPGCEGVNDSDELDPTTPPLCANGLDDDQDGLVDLEDIGCSSASDQTEINTRPRPQCANRSDDDQDGQIDYPRDHNCTHPGDQSEFEDGYQAPCADGIDNDMDGVVDFPAEPGCSSEWDYNEDNPEPLPACSNRVDDDMDMKIDFPDEPGCTSAGDDDETDPDILPQCSNGSDDDGDRAIDYPDDPECLYAADTLERE